MIIVTPYLVAPVGAAQLATPRDGLEDPSDLQRLIERRDRPHGAAAGHRARTGGRRRRLVGPAGFMLD